MNYKEFFYFQKSDRSVLIVLLSVAIIVSVLLYGIGGSDESTPIVQTDSVVVSVGDSMLERERQVSHHADAGFYQVEEVRTELFPFDPNTADSTQLLRLGLQPWQVRNIYKYRAKGGVYREPKDFARLYGLTVKQYRELEPYIRISDDYLPASTLYEKEKPKTQKKDGEENQYPQKIREGERVDLSLADTAMLKRVPGIGSYYARAIVRYGKRLGGYVQVSQLREIEDLPDDVVKYFEISRPHVRKMNLNTLTLGQLKSHPYLNFYQARAIIDYRRLKGALKGIEDLRLMKEFSASDIDRLWPYIEF
ncbi:MAG: helix-hairpin-helix domain-containing protein [Prevotella sp.]|nr:helix-hairpin-helix domain-containing protein [Prevotella sp.]